MLNHLLTVLLLSAGTASSATHTIDVRVTDGENLVAQTVKLTDGVRGNFAGPVAGGRMMIFNALIKSHPNRPEDSILEYQLEVSVTPGQTGSVFQAQSGVGLRPGKSVTVVQCGPHTAELTLDAPGRLGKNRSPAPWYIPGLGNYRLSEEMTRGSMKHICRNLILPGMQGNVVERWAERGGKSGSTMNILVKKARQAGAAVVEYQIEHSPKGMPSVQLQNQETLTFGRKTATAGEGFSLSLMAEDRPARARPE